jgi:hypothetical protein
MGGLSVDRARQLLGGGINGHDFVAAHADRRSLTLVTPQRRGWRRRDPNRHAEREVRPGSRLIATGAVLLLALGCGLLAVSYAAQYAYVLHERGQHVASLIEAGALDVGMIIFALLAMGLARAGKPAKIERAAVVACAAGSALMNFAPAQASDWRSVLAWTMPPIFLAFVVDRVVRTIQRHVLGEDEGRSPWAVLGLAVYRLARFTALTVLYSLRFVIDRRGTWAGVKQAIILATPLPAARPAQPQASRRAAKAATTERKIAAAASGAWPTTKTAQLLDLVKQRHGELAEIPLDQVSRIATALAAEAGLHPASARTALLGAVRAALPAGGSDSR